VALVAFVVVVALGLLVVCVTLASLVLVTIVDALLAAGTSVTARGRQAESDRDKRCKKERERPTDPLH
jgi:hypothetical protein